MVKIATPVRVVANRPLTLWAYEQALRRPNADALAIVDRAGPAFSWPVAGPATVFLSEPRARRLIDGCSFFTRIEVSEMTKSLCIALSLAVLCSTAAVADEKPDADLAANAALKYWQAFATMPKLDENFSSKDIDAMPLNAKTKELIASAHYSLEQMHYGAALRRCVWAISLKEDGIGTRLPECQAARNLVALARLRHAPSIRGRKNGRGS